MIFQEKSQNAERTLNDSQPVAVSPPSYDSEFPTSGPSTPSRLPTLDGEAKSGGLNLKDPYLTPPTNKVSILEDNSAVKGSWTLDTSLNPPAALLGPVKESEYGTRPNLRLESHNGAVYANVRLVRGDDQPRALLDLSSHNGSVRLAVTSRGKQAIHIEGKTHNGSIKVHLPRDFTGLVQHRTHNGTTVFSPAVKSSMTTFSVTNGVGKSFIGDWQKAEFPQPSDFSMDAYTPPIPTSLTHLHERTASWASATSSSIPPELYLTPPPPMSSAESYVSGSGSGSGGAPSVIASSTLAPSSSISQQASHYYQSRSTTPTNRASSTVNEYADWFGDFCNLETVNGTIRVCFVDEPKEGSSVHSVARAVKSWWTTTAAVTLNNPTVREAGEWVKEFSGNATGKS